VPDRNSDRDSYLGSDSDTDSHRSRYGNADSHCDSKPNTYTYPMPAL
jgi:hypothetical protein